MLIEETESVKGLEGHSKRPILVVRELTPKVP